MDRSSNALVACCLCPVIHNCSFSRTSKAWHQRVHPPCLKRLRDSIRVQLPPTLGCGPKKWSPQLSSSGNFARNSGNGKEPDNSVLTSGLWLAGVAAYILNFVSVDPASALDLSSIAGFRGVPEIEERLKGGLKQAEVAFDSVADLVPSSQPTAEESRVYRELIEEVWEVVNGNYMDTRGTGYSEMEWAALRDEAMKKPLKNKQSAYRAVREMLAKGLNDPYSRLVPQEEFDSIRKYDMSGVGLNVGTADDFVKNTASPLPKNGNGGSNEGVWVMGLMKNSPADGAGMLQGDQILEINGNALQNISPFKAAVMMKGEDSDSDSVKLKVRRPEGQVEDLLLKRTAAPIPSPVKGNVQVAGNRRLGFLQLTSFNARAQEDLVKLVKEVEGKAATELILDLRDNRGGLVQEGVEVAKLFLDGDSTIVITQESGAKGQTKIVASGPPVSTLPLTVLVNQNTASASEIVAGAIKDNCRGVLAGSKTYGKGLIQSVYALSDGSGLVLTVGKYLTPSMVDIDREGIQPDFKRIPSTSGMESAIKACKASRT